MTLITLPKINQTGANEWLDVQDNDEAIAKVVNGELNSENIVPGGVTTGAIAKEGVTLEKLSPDAKANFIPATSSPSYVTTVGNGSGPKIARGAFAIELVQPGGVFQGQANGVCYHGLGTYPASVMLTPIIGLNYTVLMNPRVCEANASYFVWQCYSSQMPSERVVIDLYWAAFS